MNNKPLLLLSALILTFCVNVPRALAQQIVSMCGTSVYNQLPANFTAAVFYISIPPLGEVPTVLRRLSNTTPSDFPIPQSLQSTLLVRRPTLSPDGQYIALRPIFEENALTVWDLSANTLYSLVLDEATAAYVKGVGLTRAQSFDRTFNNLLAWHDEHTLSIRRFSASSYAYAVESEQLIYVTQAGLVASPVVATTAIPEALYIASQMPSLSAFSVVLNNQFVAIAGTTANSAQVVAVLNAQGNAVYTDISSQDRQVSGVPLWFGSGHYLFYREALVGSGFQPVILNSQSGFNRDSTFYSIVDTAFNYPTVDAGFPATVSSDGERIALMTAERYLDRPALPFLITYNPARQQLTVNCVEAAEVNYALGNSFWLSNDQYVGFRSIVSGYLVLFEPTTGSQFYFTGGHVVGVVE